MYDGNIARHIASRSEAVIDRRDRAFSLYEGFEVQRYRNVR